MKYSLLFFFMFLFISNGIAQTNKAKELVSQMTLEEKVNLVVGMGMNLPGLNLNNSGPVIGQMPDLGLAPHVNIKELKSKAAF